MTVRVRYLGPAGDWAGRLEEEIGLEEGALLSDLMVRLFERYEALGLRGAVVRFAVNEAFVTEDVSLRDGDVVGVIPPVSGG